MVNKISSTPIFKEFNTLPRLPVEKKPTVAEKIGAFIAEVIKPYMLIISQLFLSKNIIKKITLNSRTITPLAQTRLRETEQKIQALAQRMGLGFSNKIQVHLTKTSPSSPAATGTPCAPHILLPAECLVKPEDLPEHLQLEKLKSNQISEEVWLQQFDEWLHKDFLNLPRKLPTSQFEADQHMAIRKAWLKGFKNQEQYHKINEFVLGHELSHITHSDVLAKGFALLGWHILSVLTFGLLFIFKDKVMLALDRKHEKRADLFGAAKTGQTQGGIEFFKHFQEAEETIKMKYPELRDKFIQRAAQDPHPALAERIRYLEAVA